MQVAIPTHARAEILEQMTSHIVEQSELENVTLFLSSAEEVGDYRARFPDFSIVPTQTSTLTEKMNYIHRFYPIGTEVLVLEDDIEEIVMKDDKRVMSCSGILGDLATDAFAAIRKKGLGLWGVQAHTNGFYMKHQLSFGLRFVVAQCFGFISSHNPDLELQCKAKTDYERTLRYFVEYGGVARYDDIGIKTKNYRNPGGLQLDGARAVKEQLSVRYLVQKFPHLCSENTKKKSKFAEMKLKTVSEKSAAGKDWKALQRIYDEQSRKA